MARSVNKVTLLGNLGKDPEIRTTQQGKRIANLTLATSEVWKDKQTEEKKEHTDWHRVVVFNDGLAGLLEKYVHKGSKIHVEGQLKTRRWTDQNGQERYSTEVVIDQFRGDIVLCDRQGGGQQEAPREQPQKQSAPQPGTPEPRATYTPNDLDDDIPF